MAVGDVIVCKGLEYLEDVAKRLISSHPNSLIYAFYGDLGAGKTTLIQAICKHLGVTDTVNSPTFALVNVYQSPVGEIYHFDFYRIKKIGELFDIGYEDYFFSGNRCFIEWPEKIEEYLPPGTIKIHMEADPEDDFRTITVLNE